MDWQISAVDGMKGFEGIGAVELLDGSAIQ